MYIYKGRVTLAPCPTLLFFSALFLSCLHVKRAFKKRLNSNLGPAHTDRSTSSDWKERTIWNNATKDKSKEKNQPNYCYENPIRWDVTMLDYSVDLYHALDVWWSQEHKSNVFAHPYTWYLSVWGLLTYFSTILDLKKSIYKGFASESNLSLNPNKYLYIFKRYIIR
jgi:hypothetical protein